MLASLTWILTAFTISGTNVCSVQELRESPGYVYRVERIAEFIDSADVIVRAVAERADSTRESSYITFRPLEWIRGSRDMKLRVPGTFVPDDDFNTNPVPYQTVRRAGQRGNCAALEYRKGSEYLLIFGRGVDSAPSLFWKPLAPFNEQVLGRDDVWVKWVRAQANRRR